ncbi:hypothetical protein VNI00_017245 [Paramarasmius palmivorus]|uniref:Uncharacterized protein n=1 Tax=Paramarasmius palmivorus TaxID=297713 RepID=A0AAW0B6R5_9AGAR
MLLVTLASQFQQHILYHLDFQGDKKHFKINPNSPVLKGLFHSAEDVADSKDLILIAPCKRDSEGNVIKFIDDDFESGNYDYHEAGHSEDPSTITAVFNVVPDEPSLGGFRSAVDDTTYSVYYAGTGIVTLSAYRILVGRFPSYPWTYILWTLSAPRHDYLPVNYGSPSEAREQFMQWERLAKWEKMPGKKQERESLQIARWWFKFLTSKEHSLNDIWNDVWFGRGNLYVTVRPDRFPISEAATLATTTPEAIRSNCESKTLSALESLPLDIIHSQNPQRAPVTLDTVVDKDASLSSGPMQTSASDMLNGATSADVYQSAGKPGSGMSSKELRNDGHAHRKKEGQGVGQWGPPGTASVELDRSQRFTGRDAEGFTQDK